MDDWNSYLKLYCDDTRFSTCTCTTELTYMFSLLLSGSLYVSVVTEVLICRLLCCLDRLRSVEMSTSVHQSSKLYKIRKVIS